MAKRIFLILMWNLVHSVPQINTQQQSAVDVSGDNQSKVTLIPFYGGGKGQSLQIIEKPDGTVLTNIIQTLINKPSPAEEINTSELENPPLPSKQELDFGFNIRNIHNTALNIMKLQEMAKKNGILSVDEENLYQKNMDELSSSAKNLAQFQEPNDAFSFQNREGLSEWFERKKASKRDKDKKKKEQEENKKEEERKKEEDLQKAAEEEKCRQKEENKRKEKPTEAEEEEEEEEEGDIDGIAIGLPPDDASVAEAKPVGLAVAGEGGVAASKPIATAVVGPGGLAIARPVGTAIAGVSPDQALIPIYAEGYIGNTKTKGFGITNKSDTSSELLNKIINKYHQI